MFDAFEAAVKAGGGEIVPVEQASALIWADPAAAGEFPGVVSKAPSIEWVQLPYAGIEKFADQLDPSLTWTCGKGVYAEPVAEHVVALMLAGFRDLNEVIPATSWPAQTGRNLLGATVVVVGAGGITESLMRLLEPWNVNFRVIRRSDEPMPGAERTVRQVDLVSVHEVIADADAVVLAAALTEETKHMVDADFLDAMATDGWLINVARGGFVDHDALVAALTNGSIAGAALDVTTPEPLPDGHRLWELPNAIITPHVANTPEMGLPLIAERVRTNIAHWIAGDRLLGLVDIEDGY